MYTPQPFHEGYLPELDGHTVYYAQYGNSAGPTIISCHGGPGSKSKSKHAAGFDLERYHVVLFDQRGCGKSAPAGSIEHNTTEDLVADMECLRVELSIEQWFVSGSSWGSALALYYAKLHPDRVQGLLLSAIFLGDHFGDAWAFADRNGAARLFPDGRAEFHSRLKEFGISTDTELAPAFLEKLTNGSEETRRAATALVASWEVNLLGRNIPVQYLRPEEVGEDDIAAATIFLHYQANQFWLQPDELLKAASQLTHIPTIIVHGRYDILCPLQSAWDLHQALPQSQFVPLPESHHAIAGDGAVARRYAFAEFLTRYAK